MKCFKIDKNLISKEEALKKVLTYLAESKAPIEMLDSTFEEPTIEYVNYLYVYTKLSGSYTASVGYDHEVRYQDYSKKTVTEWKPISGNGVTDVSYLYSEIEIGKDFKSSGFEYDVKYSLYKYLDDESNKVKNMTENTDADLSIYLDKCVSENCNHAYVSLPGDRYKDFSYSVSSVEESDATEYQVPFYIIKFVYEEKAYSVVIDAIGLGCITISEKLPLNNLIGQREELKKSIEEERKKGLTGIKILDIAVASRYASLIFTGSLFVIIVSICFMGENVAASLVFMIIGILCLVFDIVCSKKYREKRKEIVKAQDESVAKLDNEIENYKETKSKYLAEILEKKGLTNI